MKYPARSWQTTLPYVLLLCAIVGLIASFALTYDKIHVLQDASFKPGCNLNPVLSCGSVMKTSQASLLGVPNTVFGLIAFSMLAMFSLALLAGATFRRWLWLGAQTAATGGVIFMHYLFFQAVFRIHAICPWCFGVWMITIPIFVGITVYNSRMHHLRLPVVRQAAAYLDKYSLDALAFWYLILLMVLLVKFWYYWSTLIR